jgi:hypothetical protein
MSEEIVGVFPGFIQDGKGERGYLKFKGRMCKMVFTNNRLIITDDKRTGGNTFFKPAPYYLASGTGHSKIPVDVDSLDSISNSSDNIQLDYESIKRIVIEKPLIENWLFRIYVNDTASPEYTITICAPNNNKYLREFMDFMRELSPTNNMSFARLK